MPSAGPFATNWYVNFVPGSTGGWVTSGTPSIAFGTSMPCQWMTVDCGNLLFNTIRTLSPTSTLIHGPGTWLLYAHAFTVLPGDTSQSMTEAVRSNSFVPSGSTFAASGWLPAPLVFAPLVSCATYASVGAFITASDAVLCACICSGVMFAIESAALPPLPIVSVPFMPACWWPATLQNTLYVPAFTPLRSSVCDSPGFNCLVERFVSSTVRLCSVLPVFVTVSLPSSGAVIDDGEIVNSASETVTPLGAAAAASSAFAIARPAATTAAIAVMSARSAKTNAPVPTASLSSRLNRPTRVPSDECARCRPHQQTRKRAGRGGAGVVFAMGLPALRGPQVSAIRRPESISGTTRTYDSRSGRTAGIDG